MTKPRTAPGRELYGLIGTAPQGNALQREWNAFFAARGLDAFFDRYPAEEGSLPERLSEMYHFDRRGYIVSFPLQKAIVPLLDALESSVEGEGRVDTVVNRGGVLHGAFLGDVSVEERYAVWKQQGN